MAPFALNPTSARIRRQYYDSGYLDNTTSDPLPEPVETLVPSIPQAAAESTPAPSQPKPFSLTAPAIIGIVSAVLLLFGIGLLLWRRRARTKEQGRLRKFELSVEKYGVGHGISNPPSAVRSSIEKLPFPRSSIEKADLSPRSFFDTDDDEDTPRKSVLSFRLSSKVPPKSPTAPKSPKSVHQWFSEAPSEPMPNGPQMQQLPPLLQTRPNAPLRVINGAPEPWTPATPSIRVASVVAVPPSRQMEAPRLPPPAALPPKLNLDIPSMPPPRRSSLVDPSLVPVYGESTSSPPHAPASLSSSPQSSPPASARKPRKLPTPPHPPPTALNLPSKYTQEQDASRPGSANSQHSPTLARLMTAVTRFTPTLNDELGLQVGDIVRVIDEYKDGWCLVQHVGRIDSARGVVPAVCLQERKRIVPVGPGSVPLAHKRSDGSITGYSAHR